MSKKEVRVCLSKSINVESDILNHLTKELAFSFSTFIDLKSTNYYVTNEVEVSKNTTQIRKCMQNNIKIVSVQFLFDSSSSTSILQPDNYLLYKPEEKEISFNLNSSNDGERYELKKRIKLDPNRKREVKVFLSSTIKDMQRERQELTKKIFPQLKYFCQQRNVDFSYVDLRWGITDEEATSAKVIETCLSEIDQARPYFIGFYGEYYGWAQNAGNPVDPLLEQNFNNAAVNYSWINQYRDRSITEIEFIYGAIRPELSPIATSNDYPSYPRSFFYFRDPLLVTRLFELGDPERVNFEESSSDASRKLSNLKEKIRSLKFPLVDGYSSIEQFGEFILEDLKKAILIDFPDDEEGAKNIRNLNSSGNKNNNNFVDSFYFSRAEYEKQLITYIENGSFVSKDKKNNRSKSSTGVILPLVIQSDIGFGKSTLLSTILSKYYSQEKVLVISQYLNNKSSFNQMIQTLIKELKNNFSLDALKTPSLTESSAQLKFLFPQFITACGHQIESQISNFSKVIIVIDELDLVVEDLNWIPSLLPSSFRLVISISNPNLIRNEFHNLRLEKLSVKDIESFTKLYLAKNSKKLNQNQLNLILQSRQTGSPLFLKTLLEELKTSATFESLTNELQKYTNAPSISDLFSSITTNWELTFSPPHNQSFVKDILSLLSVSKNGLEESEIRDILNLSYSSHWANFISVLKDVFYVKNNLISFPHLLFREAIEKAKLSSINTKNHYRILITRYFSLQSSNPRKFEELPYQLHQIGSDRNALNQLFSLLQSDFELTEYLYSVDRNSLIRYWDHVVKNENLINNHYNNIINNNNNNNNGNEISSFIERLPENEISIRFAGKTAKVFKALGYFNLANEIIDKIKQFPIIYSLPNDVKRIIASLAIVKIEKAQYIEASSLLQLLSSQEAKYHALLALIAKKKSQFQQAKEYYRNAILLLEQSVGAENPKLATFISLSADVDRKLGNYSEAVSQYNLAIKIAEKNYGKTHPKVSEFLNNLGLIAKKESLYSDALDYYSQSASIILKNYGENHVSYGSILNNIGDVHRKKGNYSEAISLYNQSLSIFEKYYGKDHPEVADVLNNLGLIFKKEGKYLEASPLFDRAISIIINTFSKVHYKYALYLNNISDIERKTGHYDKSIELYKEALEINKELLGANHIEVAEVYNNLGMVYKKKGLYSDARSVYEQALMIILSNFGAVHVKMGLYLNNLADVYRKEKNYSKSLQVYDKALQVIKHSLGENHSEVAEIYQNISLVLISQEKFSEAKDYLDKSLLILRSEFGENHPKIGLCLCKFGMLDAQQNQPSKAISTYLRSLKILQDSLSPSHPEVGDLLVNLGDAQVMLRQNNQAIGTYCQALKIVRDSFGITHYKYTEISEKITSLGGKIPLFTPIEKPQKSNSKNKSIKNNAASSVGSLAFASSLGFF